MSTRCTLHFHGYGDHVEAIVYRHMDGYPDTENGVLADLERFFEDARQRIIPTLMDDVPLSREQR